jgi:hypothetical protein
MIKFLNTITIWGVDLVRILYSCFNLSMLDQYGSRSQNLRIIEKKRIDDNIDDPRNKRLSPLIQK